MIEVTRMNGLPITINAELIESVDEVPDTVITMTTGKKLIVKESREQVKDLVRAYKRDIFSGIRLEN
jgi:flagellar protein FlbD